ncbi:MAG TPA: L-threonylcarbamoyladenylate synthase [Thermoplasmata archaeon]|nr:L-threonylcarbamoyladenylate synthase [Thermoplasmata archaeon]
MDAAVTAAARALRAGGLIVYPTDTLFGLGARATDRRAVAHLESTKGRTGQPLSIAVSSFEELETWADLTPPARRWVRRHLPGPYTVLVRPSALASRTLPTTLVPPDAALAVRIPDHSAARELARRSGPIVATSANHHGQPPCRTVDEARRAFGPRVAAYVATRPRPSGRPSTFIDLRGDRPRPVARR